MINCIDHICKNVHIIITDENGKIECRLSHLINKYNLPLLCPCIECILRPTCLDPCEQKRILAYKVYKLKAPFYQYEIIK